MKSVNIHEAKTHLSRLVERVEAGEEFIIARGGRPAARLVPIDRRRKPVKIGGLKAALRVPDDFDSMFEADIEALFSGVRSARGARGRKK